MAQLVKNPQAMWETCVRSQGWEDSPVGGHGNPLQYPWLENPHGQRSLAGCSPWSHRVGHDWATKHRIGLVCILLIYNLAWVWASPVTQMVKNLPAMWETRVQSPGWEDPLEKGMTTHSNILAWGIPWIEEPGGLQSMGCQRVGHNWATNASGLSLVGLYCKHSTRSPS